MDIISGHGREYNHSAPPEPAELSALLIRGWEAIQLNSASSRSQNAPDRSENAKFLSDLADYDNSRGAPWYLQMFLCFLRGIRQQARQTTSFILEISLAPDDVTANPKVSLRNTFPHEHPYNCQPQKTLTTTMNKITGALIDEATHIRAIAKDVVLSGTYFYPIKGIIYTLNRPTLRQPLLSRSSKTLTLGVGVTTAMFFFTYVPQAAIMSITSGPLLAPFSAALLVLSESSTITTFLARSFLLADAITATFDATLVEMGQEKLLEQSGKSSGDDAISRLGSKEEVEERQTNMWNMLGKKVGEGVHERWFALKGWKKGDRARWVGRWRGKYTGFGMAAFALEMVPFVSIAFAFTNTVGAALWAADWEKSLHIFLGAVMYKPSSAFPISTSSITSISY
ncbi:EI24 domain-containing protein [Aspergillus niger CBS 101883]|uniref:EI24 domain-containing protein n=1 Tax=Aspergillus lacticoffeatus (strain CBS 101883) TaxID=1450533 RepID=UPI000D7F8873|nr:uncharacterized protein BO96DRAFT_465202 [Aspergillus niger CBS 101883]PYH57581.1 hypothetical protein BO96DRAFT_465202 [Aspergillus niger CBS 101883]